MDGEVACDCSGGSGVLWLPPIKSARSRQSSGVKLSHRDQKQSLWQTGHKFEAVVLHFNKCSIQIGEMFLWAAAGGR